MTLLGLNLRVTGYSSQGGRKYMEDAFCIAAQETEDGQDLEYAFFAIYDGHGGREAAVFAKEHLMGNIVNLRNFWSDDDNLVMKAIRDGFLSTHLAMWKEVENWPKTTSGLPSTAGTTASVAFLRKGKLYIGHVGDSRIVLGYNNPDSEVWEAQSLTTDHKPDTPDERKRIYESGGLVMKKSGVDRVVWKRPRVGHQGPVRRSTDFDKIPFLAVARSLGDLWSYDFLHGEFVVSPEPDVSVVTLKPGKDRCLIIASDGLWNVLTPAKAVFLVQNAEQDNEYLEMDLGITNPKDPLLNIPSKVLVNKALKKWSKLEMRADNTSVITIIIDHNDSGRSVLQQEQDFVKMMLAADTSEETEARLNKSEEDENVNIYHDKEKVSASERKSQSRIENLRSVFVEEVSGTGENSDENTSDLFSYRLSSSPLQSLNVSHEQSLSSNSQENESDSADNKLSPFPRWSKSATGQTSLSKLASWSRLVNKRRLSEPVSHRTIGYSHSTAVSLEVPNHSKFKLSSQYKEITKVTADTFLASLTSFDDRDSNERSLCHHKVFGIDSMKNLSVLRQTVKRKYPGAEVSYCHTFDCSSHFKCECTMPWKRKPVTNRLNITAFEAINEFRMSQNRRLQF